MLLSWIKTNKVIIVFQFFSSVYYNSKDKQTETRGGRNYFRRIIADLLRHFSSIPARRMRFLLLHIIQTSSEAHTIRYLMDSGGLLPRDEATRSSG